MPTNDGKTMKKIVSLYLILLNIASIYATVLDDLDCSFDQDFSIQKGFSLSNGPDPIIPYSPCEFTKITEKQIRACEALTNHPKWETFQDVTEYYALHEESQLDRNFCFMATHLMGVIIHGGLRQDDLAFQLKEFDIRRLLSNGPYKNPCLSMSAQDLIYKALQPLSHVIDTHLHNLGYDEGNYLNPESAAYQKAERKDYLLFATLRYAAGMSFVHGSTHEARKRIHLYAGHFPKLAGMILPIHKSILPSGKVEWKLTGSFLNNHSALVTAMTFENPYKDSELFPAVSIHPFDIQWREKLLDAYAKGIRLVKWMPPQSIPPDSPFLDSFYQWMSQLKMTLIAHAGMEHAIPTSESNKHWSDWGNPLRFRKPLQKGVSVILAHCGHKDLLPDLDDPKQNKIPGYQLFIRLAREAHRKNKSGEWTGLLYGDLAAVTTHYGPDFIKELLKVANEPGIRLLYGSDYPYTNLVQPKNDAYDLCCAAGLLSLNDAISLKEIRSWNPLLANFIFTKTLAWLVDDQTTLRFPEASFTGEFKGAEVDLINRFQWTEYKKQYSLRIGFKALSDIDVIPSECFELFKPFLG